LRRAAGREWKWEKSEEWKWKWKEGIREEGLTRSEDFGGGVVQVVSEPWHRTHSMEADANDIFAPALAFPSSVLSDGPSPNGLQFFFFFVTARSTGTVTFFVAKKDRGIVALSLLAILMSLNKIYLLLLVQHYSITSHDHDEEHG
jgi:hypothetical protein